MSTEQANDGPHMQPDDRPHCPHNELQRATVLEQTVCYCCKQCAAKFTIKPFEIRVRYPEVVEGQEGEKGR